MVEACQTLDDSGKTTIGDEVYVVGNPYGLEGTFSQGKVIGVAVATFKGGQNLNFAILAFYLSKLLSQTR